MREVYQKEEATNVAEDMLESTAREGSRRLPEYIEAHGVNVLLRAAPNFRARLQMVIE